MATLVPGEKARMYALGKIMRGGASRGGYVSGQVFIAIDGVHVGFGGTPGPAHVGVLLDSLTITDELDETPNTCAFRLNGTVPAAGSEVVVTLGSKNGGTRLYAGFALTVQQLYVGDKPANVQADVRCVDYTWQFGFLTVTRQYRNLSASAIAADLVTRYAAANGFTSGAVVPQLPVLDEITFTNEPLDAALTRVARRIGGYWFVDYQKAVHLFLEDTANAPEALTPTHKSLRAFQAAADRTQVLTRVYVEGRGSTCLATIGAGAPMMPIAAGDMFAVGPDIFAKVSPQGSTGGAQHLTFTGVTAGGGGSLVGSGSAPTTNPGVALTSGGAMTPGPHYYAYTWVSAVGETLIGPASRITVTGTAPAAVAPSIAVAEGSGLAAGVYTYAVSHVLASGETGTVSAGLTTCSAWIAANADPQYTITGLRTVNGSSNLGAVGDRLVCRQCWRQTTAQSPATVGPTSAQLTLLQGTGAPGTACAVLADMNYAALAGSNAHYVDIQIQNLTRGTGWQTVLTYASASFPYPTTFTLSTVTFSPAATETPGGLQKAAVTVTVNDGGAGVTARRVYRTKQGGGPLYFLRQVSGSAETSFTDTTADTALVTPAPAGLGAQNTVTVTGIAPGPHSGGGGVGTTARRLYRTMVDDATWQLVATIADNTTTTYTDAVADGALGPQWPPSTDTAGLVSDTGQVLAGAVTIPVSSTGPFPATGGWVLAGNNRIHYAGVSASALTGIPAAGEGSIGTTIPYGTPATLAPMLTGIPASGAGAITAPVVAGDEVYLVVRRDDAGRQAAVADMVNGGPGVREEWVQDRRLSIAEAGARAEATLAMRPLEDVTITYVCRDLRTASGKTITVNLPAPTNVFGTFKIQSVTINNFRPHPTQYPTYTVTASSRRFNFEDWLRRMETSV